MAYEGEPLNVCLAQAFDFTNTSAVSVTGAWWNPCGHMLLNVGGEAGFYFHIAGGYRQPRVMRSAGFRRYLEENEKSVIKREMIHIPNPKKAQARLDDLLAKPWLWMGLPNNCSVFIEEVVRAGGAKTWLLMNCPAKGSLHSWQI